MATAYSANTASTSEEPALGGFRLGDVDLAREQHGDGDDAQERREALGIHAPRLVHSTMPRRIASATAAARSDTPSFSYSRPRCDLTVVVPRYSRWAI